MSRGKRYEQEPKLNLKKVFAVIIAIVVIIMVILGIKNLLTQEEGEGNKETKTYFTIYTNGKWGVIDQKANEVIAPEYTEMIVIPNNKVDVFVATYDVNYEDNTYKTKVLNSKKETLFTDFELVEPLFNYDSNEILYYEDNVLKVKKDGKFGLIDFKGNVLVECKYDQIDSLKRVTNSILLTKDGKVGLCDNKGTTIIDTNYKQIKPIGKDYKDGYIVVNEENKQGVIDFNKTTILEVKYEEVKQVASPDIFIVKQDGKLKAIERSGNVLLEDKFEEVKQINGENLIFVKDQKQGIITKTGEEKIAPEYEDLQYAFSDNYIAKKDGKYGVINLAKETKVNFEYDSISYVPTADIIQAQKGKEATEILDPQWNPKLTAIISKIDVQKGYMRLRIADEYHYYNFKFEEKQEKDIFTTNTLFLSKKDGKYGYVDKDGKVIVDYQYEDAMPQNSYGYVAVKKDGKWGSLNKEGNIVGEFKYSLENNLIIDFIGKWHYAEDINANYYTDQ